MRRGLIIGAIGVGLAAAIVGWIVLSSKPSVTPVVSVELPSEATFAPVEVRAQGTEGLTLTGVVHDPSGAPIANAEVFLAASSQPSLTGVKCEVCSRLLLSCHAHESARTVSTWLEKKQGQLHEALTTRSDDQGRFQFKGLAGTSFTVWGRATGFGDGLHERSAPGDEVELVLPVPRVLEGRVRDEDGAPVPAAHVRLMSRRLARVLEFEADAEGRFSARGLGEGPFAVSAVGTGLLPTLLGDVEADAAPVVLTLVRPRRLEVRVVNEGKPARATVSLQGDHLTRQLDATDGFLAVDALYPGQLMVSASGADGLASAPQRVTLSSLVTQITVTLERGGTLAVTAVDEAGQPVPNPIVEVLTHAGERVSRRKLQTGELAILGPLGAGAYQLRATSQGFHEAIVPVEVKTGEQPVEITLTKGTTISGRVLDEYGRPAPGVPVLVSPLGETVASDAEGRFFAPVPTPGLYDLLAHHSDWGGGELKVEAPKDDVVLQLEPRGSAAVTVSIKGRRVEGAAVVLYHSTGSYRNDRPSGADGVVLMRGLPAGEYLLIATHPAYLPSERATITLREGELQRIEASLGEGSTLRGVVVDTSGVPVPQVTVSAGSHETRNAITDAQGRFSLSPLRPDVTYEVVVRQKGFEQVEAVSAQPSEDVVRVVVKRQPVFRGRVLGEGKPLKSFRIDEQEITSADGRFEVSLPALENRVLLSIEAPGFEPMMAERPNSPELGDFDLKRVPLVTGVVRDISGSAVSDAVVTCDACEQSVLSDAEGHFSLGMPAFQHEVSIVAKKGRRTGTKTVLEGALQGIEVQLKPNVKLSGAAYLSNGQPAAGQEVGGILLDRGETVSAVTNADGTYAMEVPPGVYRFQLNVFAGQAGEDPLTVIAEVSGETSRLDLGAFPGSASLAVRLVPKPGYALWLVRGTLTTVASPPMDLLRSKWAQMLYQPTTERVVLTGIIPGRYTLVWASFHASEPEGNIVVPVEVPGPPEVQMVR